MSATITTAFVPNSLPILEVALSVNGAIHAVIYPATIQEAIDFITSQGITSVDYDEIIDTRLLHDVAI